MRNITLWFLFTISLLLLSSPLLILALAQDKQSEAPKAADKPIPSKPKKELPEVVAFDEAETLKLRNKQLQAEKLSAQIEAVNAQIQTAYQQLQDAACRAKDAPALCALLVRSREQIEEISKQRNAVAGSLQADFNAIAAKHGVTAEDLQKYTVANGESDSEKPIELKLRPKAGPPPGFTPPVEAKTPPK